jgi:hypothetical protein
MRTRNQFKMLMVKRLWYKGSKVTGYGPDSQDLTTSKAQNVSLLRHIQIGSGTHPASRVTGARDLFPGDKTA